MLRFSLGVAMLAVLRDPLRPRVQCAARAVEAVGERLGDQGEALFPPAFAEAETDPAIGGCDGSMATRRAEAKTDGGLD